MSDTSFCYIHDKDETITDGGRVCFECKHSYADDAEIAREFEVLRGRQGLDPLTDMIRSLKSNSIDIGFCPLCLHDW